MRSWLRTTASCRLISEKTFTVRSRCREQSVCSLMVEERPQIERRRNSAELEIELGSQPKHHHCIDTRVRRFDDLQVCRDVAPRGHADVVEHLDALLVLKWQQYRSELFQWFADTRVKVANSKRVLRTIADWIGTTHANVRSPIEWVGIIVSDSDVSEDTPGTNCDLWRHRTCRHRSCVEVWR